MRVQVAPHPLLDAAAFLAECPKPLGELLTPPSTLSLLALDAPAPFPKADDATRGAIRDLLRHGGYKPTGRGKPASEYLLRAVGEGALKSINAVVDVCNVVSLHSGLPISVIDIDLAKEPFSLAIAKQGDRYVFNATGQEIDVAGLLCLFDAQGPCANAVKDSQRTKTTPATRRTLWVVWGSIGLRGGNGKDSPKGKSLDAAQWCQKLLLEGGCTSQPVDLTTT